jgi:lipid A disaccharide synthetase
MTMTKDEIKNLVQTLLKHRPDLVIVVTDNEQEKMTLVTLLKNAGGKVIYQNTTL